MMSRIYQSTKWILKIFLSDWAWRIFTPWTYILKTDHKVTYKPESWISWGQKRTMDFFGSTTLWPRVLDRNLCLPTLAGDSALFMDLRQRGLALAQRMKQARGNGAPSYKQIMMEKGKSPLEGVQITGLETTRKNELSKKTKLDGNTKETRFPHQIKGIKILEGKDKPDPTQGVGKNTKEVEATETSPLKGPDPEEPAAENNQQRDQGRWKPKTTESLRVIITDPKMQAYRDHMAIHAVICKFMGFCPTEQALCQWIKQTWKSKGDVKLHLGAKGFFTMVFANLEDRDHIFDGGTYFYASAGLYMRPWKPNFAPK